MTHAHFKLSHVWIFCLSLSLLYGEAMSAAQIQKDIDRLATAYRAAKTEFDRRAVCLEAIDAGVVARDRSVSVIDAVFGTSYSRKLPPAGGLETGIVEFHPLPPPPNDAVAAARVGWYFAFQFDSAGKLQNYYLTNVHK
jgi:hypothetical protein